MPDPSRLTDFVYGSTTYVVEAVVADDKRHAEAGSFGARYVLRGPLGAVYLLIPTVFYPTSTRAPFFAVTANDIYKGTPFDGKFFAERGGRLVLVTEQQRRRLERMTLTTDQLGDIPQVDSATLDETLRSGGFGEFAILGASEDEFIQAAKDSLPGEEHRVFLQKHDSDPWVLEYRENGRQFRAADQITLEQVLLAFQSYLAGGLEWRSGFAWAEVQL